MLLRGAPDALVLGKDRFLFRADLVRIARPDSAADSGNLGTELLGKISHMKSRSTYVCRVLVCLCCWAACGCGSANTPQRAAIEGQVTFNGEPIEMGSIQFIPEKGVVGKPVATRIDQGRYELSADKGPAVGKNRVSIQATRKTGKQIKNIMGELEDQREEFIPKKYNEGSELVVEIKPGNNNEDFHLEETAP